MNGGVSPFLVVLRIIITVTIAVIIPNKYILYVIISAFPTPNAVTIAPAIAVKIGNLAPQLKKGITLIVVILSFSSPSVLVFNIAGTLQPNPIIIGINALPDKPNLRNILSKIKATLAIYPLSSKIEKNKNNTKI